MSLRCGVLVSYDKKVHNKRTKMTQLTGQDIEIIKELISKNTELIFEKMESIRAEIASAKTELKMEIKSVSDKVDLLDKRVERLENGSDKISTAVIIALLIGLVKWLFFSTPLS